MSKAIPMVSKFMTTSPVSIEPNQPLSEAKKKMQELGVRHLPVRSGGDLAGILSERDVTLLSTFKDVDLSRAKVKDAMSLDVFKVSPDTPVSEVISEMAESKYGSALVVETNGALVGIFTTVDAMRAFGTILEQRHK